VAVWSSRALGLWLRVPLEEVPDQRRAIELAAHLADQALRQVLRAARPGVAAAIQAQQHHAGCVAAIRVADPCGAAGVVAGLGSHLLGCRRRAAAIELAP